jgi:hypothetical protein
MTQNQFGACSDASNTDEERQLIISLLQLGLADSPANKRQTRDSSLKRRTSRRRTSVRATGRGRTQTVSCGIFGRSAVKLDLVLWVVSRNAGSGLSSAKSAGCFPVIRRDTRLTPSVELRTRKNNAVSQELPSPEKPRLVPHNVPNPRLPPPHPSSLISPHSGQVECAN